MKNNATLVSIIITVFNKEIDLPNTLHSLFWQQDTTPNSNFHIEYIFVDDFSTDSSIAIIEHATRDMTNVRIVRNVENAGPAYV